MRKGKQDNQYQNKKAQKINEDDLIVIPKELEQYKDFTLSQSKTLFNAYAQFKSRMMEYDLKLGYQGTEMVEHWINYFFEAAEYDMLEGTYNQYKVGASFLSKSPSEEILFKSFDFFNAPWKVRFSRKFIKKFCEQRKNLKMLITCYIWHYANGHVFYNSSRLGAECPPYMEFFTTNLTKDKKMLWMVGIERMPELDKEKKIRKFEFVHYMRFVEIFNEKELRKTSIYDIANSVKAQFRKDPARCDFSYELEERLGKRNTLFEKVDTLVGSAPTMTRAPHDRKKDMAWLPTEFKYSYLTKMEASSMIYSKNLGRWIHESAKAALEHQKLNQYSQSLNNELMKKYMDFSSATRLVELLESIPNFKIKLTPEEKAVIGQSGNVLALGRSGTGKTTCAILRLFSMEIIFKVRLTQAKIKHEGLLRDTKFAADDVDSSIGLHCVFVTASPVLTNEVSRYYHRLTDQIKAELKKKEEKIREKKRKEFLERKQKAEEELKKIQEEKKDGEMEIIMDKKELTEKETEEEKLKELQAEIEMAEEQMKEIQLEDQGDDIEEEEEIIDDNVEQINKMQKYEVFRNIDEKDFPLFLTVRRLVLMIDGTLARPFFTRNYHNQVIQSDMNAQWHNEMKGVLMIDDYHKKIGTAVQEAAPAEDEEKILSSDSDYDPNDYAEEADLEEEYQRQINIQTKKKRMKTGGAVPTRNKQLSFEIDFEFFERNFWPAVVKKYPHFHTPAIVVWSEMMSYIKGSSDSHQYLGWYLPRYVYRNKESEKKTFLSTEVKDNIWDIFTMYERWKTREGAYDFMDVVNYILVQLKYRGYSGQPIHYMMIDEVQDLSHATILLLSKVTEHGLFFSGDTAQTIAKGVGLRFSDLGSIFDRDEGMFSTQICKPPSVHQLTINFRSHGRILDLANSIVNLIEKFFPKTIDRLKKEKSNIDGPKPILLADIDQEVLFCLLFGVENYKSQMHSAGSQGGLLNRQPIEFGCNQVILVRDQKSKENLPPLLQHALCLTIYEAKGLEFDDVILYNFFSDSSIEEFNWGLLNFLELEEVQLSEAEFEKTYVVYEGKDKHKRLSDLADAEGDEESKKEGKEGESEIQTEKEPKEEDQEKKAEEQPRDTIDSTALLNTEFDPITKTYKIKRVILKPAFAGVTVAQYSMLCSELKQLYVAITRPRNRLIIYDENTDLRWRIAKYWQGLDLVQVIDRNILKQAEVGENTGNKDVDSFRALVTKTSEAEWRKQGIKMFNHKYYEQALKCFEHTSDNELKTRARAYYLAEKANKTIQEVQNEYTYMEEGIYGYSNLKRQDRMKEKLKLEKRERQAKIEFKESGELFKKIGLFKQAAQCFFSAGEYMTAAQIFADSSHYKQAGEAHYALKDFQTAGEYFDKAGDYIRAIDCFASLKQYQRVLEIVNKHTEMTREDREAYAKKYVPLALEGLVVSVDLKLYEEQKAEEERKAKEAEKARKEKEKVIREEDEEDELSDFEDEDEEDDKKKKKKPAEEEEEELSDEEFEDEDEEEAPKKPAEKEAAKPEPKQNGDISQMSLNGDAANKDAQEAKNGDVSEMSFNDKSVAQEEEKSRAQEPVSNSFSVVQENTSQKKDVSDMSFDNLEITSKKGVDDLSFSQLGAGSESGIKEGKGEQLEGFDHLSNFDPDDEWLKMEKGSIIDSISEVRRQKSNVFSDYSAVDFNHVMSNQCQIVKTKQDIFVQDNVMQNIIKIISMFSEDIKTSLLKLRSKSTLLSQKENLTAEEAAPNDPAIDFIIDLDFISIDFIYLVLDLLEMYKLYKLCIFVCNRYKLSNRIGRYLVNIAHKYSNFPSEDMSANSVKLFNPIKRQIQLEKAFVANVALHTVLENINPTFIEQKKKGEVSDASNSLGHDCYQELINLGFWKKCLFIMDYDNSLALASTFASFKNYKLLFLQGTNEYKFDKIKLEKQLENVDFEFIPFKTPSNLYEIRLACVALDAVIWDLTEKMPIVLNKHYISSWQLAPATKVKVPSFPSYFAFNGIFWNFMFDRSEENYKLLCKYLEDGLTNLGKIIKNPTFKSDIIELRIYDLVTFFMLFNLYSQFVPKLNEAICDLSTDMIILFVDVLRFVTDFLTNALRLTKYSDIILNGILTPLRLRNIQRAPVLEHISESFIIAHISSPILAEFLSSNKQPTQPERLNPKGGDPTKVITTQSSYIIDMDANFILCSLKPLFKSLRTRLTASLTTIVSSHVKKVLTNPKFDFILKREECDSYTEFYEDNAQVEKELYSLVLVLTLIEKYVNSQEFGKMKNNLNNKDTGPQVSLALNYSKTDPLYEYAKQELKRKLDELIKLQDIDPNTEFEREGEILAAKRERQIKQIRKYLNYVEANESPFSKQKRSILRLIKYYGCFTLGNKISQVFNVSLREGLLSNLNSSVKLMFHKCKPNLKLIGLYHYVGMSNLFNEVIRANKKQPDMKYFVEDISYANDAFAYLLNDCTEDYGQNLFEFFSKTSKSMKIEFKQFMLRQASIVLSIASNAEKPSFFFSSSLIKCLGGLEGDKSKGLDENGMHKVYTLKRNLNPLLTSDLLYECVYWVNNTLKKMNTQLSEGEQNLELLANNMYVILLNIALNIHPDVISKEILNEMNDALYNLRCGGYASLEEPNLKLFELKGKNAKDFALFQEKFASSSEAKRKTYLPAGKETFHIINFKGQDLTDQNYEEAEKAWLRDQALTAKRIIAKRAFTKHLNIRKFKKLRPKLYLPQISQVYICQIFNTALTRKFVYEHLLNAINANHTLFGLFYHIDEVLIDIMNVFFTTNIENPIDFHYIVNQLTTVTKLTQEYAGFLKEVIQTKVFDQVVNNRFVKYKISLDEINASFQVWKKNNAKQFENIDARLKKKRALIGVKWEERTILSKAQKIAKKRSMMKKMKAVKAKKQ